MFINAFTKTYANKTTVRATPAPRAHIFFNFLIEGPIGFEPMALLSEGDFVASMDKSQAYVSAQRH